MLMNFGQKIKILARNFYSEPKNLPKIRKK